jgi:hypothetical protein
MKTRYHLHAPRVWFLIQTLQIKKDWKDGCLLHVYSHSYCNRPICNDTKSASLMTNMTLHDLTRVVSFIIIFGRYYLQECVVLWQKVFDVLEEPAFSILSVAPKRGRFLRTEFEGGIFSQTADTILLELRWISQNKMFFIGTSLCYPLIAPENRFLQISTARQNLDFSIPPQCWWSALCWDISGVLW